jgi:hypothetical protein
LEDTRACIDVVSDSTIGFTHRVDFGLTIQAIGAEEDRVDYSSNKVMNGKCENESEEVPEVGTPNVMLPASDHESLVCANSSEFQKATASAERQESKTGVR